MMSYWMDVPNMMGANQKCWSGGRVTSTNGQNGPRNEQSRSSVNRNQQFRDVCRMWKKTSDQPNNLSLRSHDNPQTLLAPNKPCCQNSTDEQRRWLEVHSTAFMITSKHFHSWQQTGRKQSTNGLHLKAFFYWTHKVLQYKPHLLLHTAFIILETQHIIVETHQWC